MKTTKETQLEILDKMRENNINERDLLEGVQFKNHVTGLWDDRIYDLSSRYFKDWELRLKPTTIIVNGVDIPKPLDRDDLLMMNKTDIVYSVNCNHFLYLELPSHIAEDQGYKFIYKTKEEAIQASKLLFGFKLRYSLNIMD